MKVCWLNLIFSYKLSLYNFSLLGTNNNNKGKVLSVRKSWEWNKYNGPGKWRPWSENNKITVSFKYPKL